MDEMVIPKIIPVHGSSDSPGVIGWKKLMAYGGGLEHFSY